MYCYIILISFCEIRSIWWWQFDSVICHLTYRCHGDADKPKAIRNRSERGYLLMLKLCILPCIHSVRIGFYKIGCYRWKWASPLTSWSKMTLAFFWNMFKNIQQIYKYIRNGHLKEAKLSKILFGGRFAAPKGCFDFFVSSYFVYIVYILNIFRMYFVIF